MLHLPYFDMETINYLGNMFIYVSLEVIFCTQDLSNANSNQAEVDEFFQKAKVLCTSPPGGRSR